MSPMNSQMLKGVLTWLLLHLLHEQEDYGYNVVVRLRDQGFGELSEGTVYPALTRLEAQGLLTSRLVRSQSGPARKYYATTPSGIAEMREAQAQWLELVAAVQHTIQGAES